jgi:hypothetical protein
MLDAEDAAFPDEDEKIIKLSPETLGQFAGKYEASGTTVTIKVERDHLIAETRADTSLLFPLNDSIFVQKKFNLRVEFKRDGEGKVTEHIIRLTKYKEFHFRKME